MPPILDRKPFKEALSAAELDDPRQQLADYIDQADAMLMSLVQLERISVLCALTQGALETLRRIAGPVASHTTEWAEARVLLSIIDSECDSATDRLRNFEGQTVSLHDRTRIDRTAA